MGSPRPADDPGELTDPRRFGAYQVPPPWKQAEAILGRPDRHRERRERIRRAEPPPKPDARSRWFGSTLDPTPLRVAVEAAVGLVLLLVFVAIVWSVVA